MDIKLYQTQGFANLTRQDAKVAAVKLSEKYFFETPQEVKYAGGGSFGIAFFVKLKSKTVVIKAFRHENLHRTQALETEILAKYCTLPMPKTLFIHDADSEIAINALGMECMDGVPCIQIPPLLRSPKKRHKMAACVVSALHSIHEAEGEKFGFLENPIYDCWLDFYKPYAQGLYEWVMENGCDPKHKMPRALCDIVKESWERFDEIFAEPVTVATLIHADLNVGNFMVNPKTLQPTAIIDPWRSMWADRDYDLHQLYNITGRQYFLYETYKEKFEVSRTCDLKCAFYALYNEIYCYTVTLMSYDYIYPRMIRNLKKQMKRFLAK